MSTLRAPWTAELPELTPATAATPAATLMGRRTNVVRLMIVAAIWALPLLRPAGPGNSGPVDVVLVAAITLALLWIAGRAQIVRFPYALPAGLTILGGAVASIVTYAHGYGSVGGGLVGLSQDVFVLVWVFTVANLGREPDLLRAMTRAWALSGTTWAAVMMIGVIGHISLLSGETAANGVRAAFTLNDPNLAANYFICSLLVLRAARYPRRPWLRWICCAVILTAIVFTGSNGGLVALVVATLLGFIFRLARRRGAAAVLVSAAIAVTSVAVVSNIDIGHIVSRAQTSAPILKDSIGRQAESANSRTTILSQTMRLYFTADTPFGVGPGGTKAAFHAHLYPYVKAAHDDYMAGVVENGLLGGVALIILLVMVAARCGRIVTRGLRPAYAAIIPRPELLQAAAVAILLSAMFYQILHFRHVWALFGIVAALDLWGRADRNGCDGGPAGEPDVARGVNSMPSSPRPGPAASDFRAGPP